MNGSEKPKGQVLDIAGMLDIAQQYHDAKQAPAATKTKTEVSVANLGFTQPATLAEINDVAVRLGYDPFPERMLANNGDRVFLPTQVFVLFKWGITPHRTLTPPGLPGRRLYFQKKQSRC